VIDTPVSLPLPTLPNHSPVPVGRTTSIAVSTSAGVACSSNAWLADTTASALRRHVPRHARLLDLDHPGGGQVESGVAQALGTALYEHLIVDDADTVTTPVLRHYHIPHMADVAGPRRR
jgi:hypothetical protein